MTTTFQHLITSLKDNPIARRESLTRNRSRSKWYWRFTWAITAFLLLAPFLWGFSPPFGRRLYTILMFLLIANIIAFPLVVIRTISTANLTMVDERNGRTWELLMLTGVGAARLIAGKWLGTMRFMLRDYVWMFVLRAGLLIWGVAHLNVQYTYGSSDTSITVLDVSLAHEMFIPILFLIVVFLVLELMLSSALGVATGIFEWSRRAGNWTAIVMRIGLPIVFGLGLLYAVGWIQFGYNAPFPEHDQATQAFIGSLSLALADNGATMNLMLALPHYDGSYNTPDIRPDIFIGQLAGALLYLIFTGLALGTATVFLRRQGVAADALPASAGTGKPKRKARPPQNASPLPQRAEHRIQTAAGVVNALGLEHPGNYRVELFQYQRRTGRLYLRLSHNQHMHYVQFSSVVYLDAPIQWTGANLRVATDDERAQFITAQHITLNSLTADNVHLYIIRSDDNQPDVHILAGTVTLLDDAPNLT
jgi:hypothetical protein